MRLVGTFYFYFSYYYYYILTFVLVAEYILYYLPAFNWTNIIIFINYYLSFNHKSVFLFELFN